MEPRSCLQAPPGAAQSQPEHDPSALPPSNNRCEEEPTLDVGLTLTWHRAGRSRCCWRELKSLPAPQASLATNLLHFRGLRKKKT